MVITVTCSSCSTSFPVDPAKIPEGGVNARCSSCGNVFRVEKPVEVEPLPELEGVDPVPPTTDREPAPEVAAVEPPAPEGPTPPSASAVDAAVADPTDQAEDGPADEEAAVPEADVSFSEAEDFAVKEDEAAQPATSMEVAADDSGDGAGREEEGIAVADADDWVVEHEEVLAMDPDPLPPIDDRLPEIADQGGEESVEPFERATPFEESMNLQVDAMEVEVEFQGPAEEAVEAAVEPGPEEHPSSADPAADIEAPPALPDSVAEPATQEAQDGLESSEASGVEEVSDAEQVPEGDGASHDQEPAVGQGASEGDGGALQDAEMEGAAEPADEPAQTSAPVQGFTFGKRDPTDKAKRLARVLVSDMIMYNAERHQSALAAGTLVQDFEEEIQKSWKEYVEQVGEEMANGEGRDYWTRALNDILAKGDEVF